jgi:hypothetical protein
MLKNIYIQNEAKQIQTKLKGETNEFSKNRS